MIETQTLAEWARQMAEAAQFRTLAKEQRHQAGLLNQIQAEKLWVDGMNQVVQILEVLVRALKRTGHFPQLSLMAYARSPQGTTTYMRRGTLLSLRGLREESSTIEWEIDSTPPFRVDLLAPTVCVITTPNTFQAAELRKTHWRLGVSVQGTVVWQQLNPALEMPPEGSVEEMLKGFLEFMIRTE
jgi:hypothetical protein